MGKQPGISLLLVSPRAPPHPHLSPEQCLPGPFANTPHKPVPAWAQRLGCPCASSISSISSILHFPLVSSCTSPCRLTDSTGSQTLPAGKMS